jgi:hypothetical protein
VPYAAGILAGSASGAVAAFGKKVALNGLRRIRGFGVSRTDAAYDGGSQRATRGTRRTFQKTAACGLLGKKPGLPVFIVFIIHG